MIGQKDSQGYGVGAMLLLIGVMFAMLAAIDMICLIKVDKINSIF
jgi:hypothetical protein